MIRAQVASLWSNKRLWKNLALATASSLVSMLVGLVSVPILTRFLSKSDYGALSYINTIQTLVLACSAPGIGNAIAMGVAQQYEGVFRIGTWHRFRLLLRNSLLILPVAGWYLWGEKNSPLASLIAFGGLLMPWVYAFDTAEQFLIGRSDFQLMFWRRLMATIVPAVSGIGAAWLFSTALAVLLARSITAAGVAIALFALMLRSVHNESLDPGFWNKSRDLSWVSVLGTISGLLDSLMLGWLGGMSVLAGYSLAKTLTSPLESLSKSFLKVVFGRVAQHRELAQRRFWVFLSLLMVLVGVPFMLVAWRAATPLVLLLFPKYPETIGFVPLLLVGFVVACGCNLGSSHSLFHSYRLWNHYYWARNASKIVVTIACVVRWGVWGAVYVQLAYFTADYAFFNVLLWGRQAQ